MTCCKQLLDYAATHPDTILTYKRSNMVLVVHSTASYLSKPKACSCAGGHFFLSSDVVNLIDNRSVLNIAALIKAVMSSAAEPELGALYINAHEAVPQRRTLEEMGHKHHCAAHHIEKCHKILTHKSVLDALCASLKRTPIPVMPLKQTPTPFQVASTTA